eukprot:gene6321-439_t
MERLRALETVKVDPSNPLWPMFGKELKHYRGPRERASALSPRPGARQTCGAP